MNRLLAVVVVLFTVTLAAASAPHVSLSISSKALANGDPFTLKAEVAGPYDGPVCFFIGSDEDQQVISTSCTATVTIAAGASQTIGKEYHVPASTKLGSYSAAVILPEALDEHGERIASNIVGFSVTSSHRQGN